MCGGGRCGVWRREGEVCVGEEGRTVKDLHSVKIN